MEALIMHIKGDLTTHLRLTSQEKLSRQAGLFAA
jgi:hypothetical protein